jgi:hypothetical protein
MSTNPGTDDLAAGVDFLGSGARDLADGGNPAVFDGYVSLTAGRACPIENLSAADDEIEGWVHRAKALPGRGSHCASRAPAVVKGRKP